MTPVFSPRQIAFFTEMLASGLAADDLLLVLDTNVSSQPKRIQAQNLLEGLLRVVPNGIVNLIPAFGNIGTLGFIGVEPRVQVPGSGTGTQCHLHIGRVNAGAGQSAFTFFQDGNGQGVLTFSDINGQHKLRLASYSAHPAHFGMASNSIIGWSSSIDLASLGFASTGIARITDKVVGMTDGQNGNFTGWLQNSGGLSRVANNVTNATVSMGAITGLSSNIQAGRKYSGELILYVNDSIAADGISIDFDGGTATMTSFRAHGTIHDTALLLSQQTTAIATDFSVGTITGDGEVKVKFSFVCNVAGTFIPRAAQTAHTTGTLTVYANSYMKIDDMP